MPRSSRPPLSRSPWAAGVLLGLICLATPSARADERIEARRHFQTGLQFIAGGRYQEGIKELQAAYKLAPHPAVLYNIGRAYLDQKQYEEAIEYLVRYLTSDPPDRDQVESLVNDARVRRDQARMVRTPPTPAQTAPVLPDDSVAVDALEMRELTQKLQNIVDRLNQARENGRTTSSGTAATAGVTPDRGAGAGAPTSGPLSGTQSASAPGASAQASTPSDASTSPPPGLNRAGTGRPGSGSTSSDQADLSNGSDDADPYAPVVVTSSRYRQSPLEAPNALTIITAQDIRQSGASTLPELFRRVPGLDVMAISPGDYNIGIRGFNATLSNKVLVLIDGRSVYLDFVGANLWPLLSISLPDIERIELIRGPGAALYGADAFSGIINIITRRPGADDDRSEVMISGGLPQKLLGVARLTGRSGASAYRASVGFEQANRWSIEVDPTRSDYQIEAASPNRSVDVVRVDARMDQRLTPRTWLSVSGGVTDGQTEFAAIGALRDFLVDGRYGYLRGDLTLPMGVSLRAFWNHFSAEAAPWTTPTGGLSLRSHPISDVVDVEAQLHRNVHLGIDHRLNAGLGYRFKTIRWPEFLGAEPVENHASLFIQDEARLASSLTAVLSLRIDRHAVLAEREGSFLERYPVSPRAALIWRVAEGQALRATVGTAFRTPTYAENYLSRAIPTDVNAVAVLTQGSLDLSPEHILSAEIGYLNQPVSNRYELEAAAYVNQVTDLIQLGDAIPWSDPATAYDPQSGIYYAGTTHYENEADAYTALGGELGMRLYPMDGVDLYANYAYEYIRRGSGADAVRDLSTSPHMLNFGARYRSRSGFDAGLDLHLVDRQTWPIRSYGADGRVQIDYLDLPAYARLGLRVAYHTPGNRLEAAVMGDNLLDAFRSENSQPAQMPTAAGAHREYPLGQPIPVGVSATLSYRF